MKACRHLFEHQDSIEVQCFPRFGLFLSGYHTHQSLEGGWVAHTPESWSSSDTFIYVCIRASKCKEQILMLENEPQMSNRFVESNIIKWIL